MGCPQLLLYGSLGSTGEQHEFASFPSTHPAIETRESLVSFDSTVFSSHAIRAFTLISSRHVGTNVADYSPSEYL